MLTWFMLCINLMSRNDVSVHNVTFTYYVIAYMKAEDTFGFLLTTIISLIQHTNTLLLEINSHLCSNFKWHTIRQVK